MANGKKPNVVIEDAQIAFRNFAGKEDEYNRAGARNFAVFLEPQLATELEDIGWNVKYLRAREDDEGEEVRQAYIQVAVSYKHRPPKIVMLTSRGRTYVDEELVEMLDWVEVKTVDLIFTPYEWSVRDNSGTKAYLKTMFITIDEDPLELKYAELEADSGPLAIEAGYDYDAEPIRVESRRADR